MEEDIRKIILALAMGQSQLHLPHLSQWQKTFAHKNLELYLNKSIDQALVILKNKNKIKALII